MEGRTLQEVCRTCLYAGRIMCSLVKSIVPKFGSPSNSVVDLWKIFSKMLKVDEDRCPDKICMECLDEIHRMYAFMLKCEKSEDVLKKMKIVSAVREQSSLENIKSENEMLPNISQIKTETIEWNGKEIVDYEEDTDWGQFEEIIHANADRQVDSPAQDTLTVKYENDNSGNELSYHLDYESNATKDEVPARHDIKQEPELVITMESGDFNEIESEEKSSTDIIKCPACPYECRIRESMEKHLIENHMEGQSCKLCNKEFQCKAIEHCSKHLQLISTDVIRESTNIKCHKCSVCSKILSTKYELGRHLNIHTGERPFKCERCPKTFVQKSTLTKHLKCHTGERPFKCDSCPKKFVEKCHLAYHLKCHKGDRPFKCEICSKTFILKCNLTTHLKSHTGDRPFKCESCPKTFVEKCHLTIHLKCHKRERRFKCEICTKTFMKKGDLTVHTIQERHLSDAKFIRRSLYNNVI